ncbi:hypothetical protein Tco_0641021 [Tanacetum coccineum]
MEGVDSRYYLTDRWGLVNGLVRLSPVALVRKLIVHRIPKFCNKSWWIKRGSLEERYLQKICVVGNVDLWLSSHTNRLVFVASEFSKSSWTSNGIRLINLSTPLPSATNGTTFVEFFSKCNGQFQSCNHLQQRS